MVHLAFLLVVVGAVAQQCQAGPCYLTRIVHQDKYDFKVWDTRHQMGTSCAGEVNGKNVWLCYLQRSFTSLLLTPVDVLEQFASIWDAIILMHGGDDVRLQATVGEISWAKAASRAMAWGESSVDAMLACAPG
jgi:hypothetical protein